MPNLYEKSSQFPTRLPCSSVEPFPPEAAPAFHLPSLSGRSSFSAVRLREFGM